MEQYALTIVPYGQLLLEQLDAAPPPAEDNDGLLLAVAGVAYDDRPQRAAPSLAPPLHRAALDEKPAAWKNLPAAPVGFTSLLAAAGKRLKLELRGVEASTLRVAAELPKARWAHFATHTFLAEAKFRSALQSGPQAFRQQFFFGGERQAAAGRNPLVLSGLVLAGANLPPAKDEYGLPRDDAGILTAEAIATLPLERLDLVVLPYCQPGSGDHLSGKGPLGLQRAFHLAGTRTVIASLWNTDDQATATLMRLFYHKLWVEKKSAPAALRQAQLILLRSPDQIDTLATAEQAQFVRLLESVERSPRRPDTSPLPVRRWAAWVLSGRLD